MLCAIVPKQQTLFLPCYSTTTSQTFITHGSYHYDSLVNLKDEGEVSYVDDLCGLLFMICSALGADERQQRGALMRRVLSLFNHYLLREP